jgi:hypothetical protein
MKQLLTVIGVVGSTASLGICLVALVTGSWQLLGVCYIAGMASAFAIGLTEENLVDKMTLVDWVSYAIVLIFGWWVVTIVTINLQREKSPLGIVILVIAMLAGVWLTRLQ